MTVVFVGRRSSFLNAPDIDSFHSLMFHGRNLNDYDRKTGWRLATRPDRTPRLLLNAYRVNHITKAGRAYIVTDAVKQILGDVPNLQFRPVEYEKVYLWPYAEGHFDHAELEPTVFSDEGQWRFLRKRKHQPELLEDFPNLFEMKLSLNCRIEKKFRNVKHYEQNIGPTPMADPAEGELCPEMLDQYPIIANGNLIISEAIFARIEPFFDWRYYVRGSCEIT